MAAAVGDFRPEKVHPHKLRRGGGRITIKLFPTADILAGLQPRKRPDQIVVAFALEDGPEDQAQLKAGEELAAKGADYVVVNTPLAMAAERSRACIISPTGVVLPWADRPKELLAREIVRLVRCK